MPRWPTRSLAERFWEKVRPNPDNGCWEWTAAINNGYGAFQIGTAGQTKVEDAHRTAWRLTKGPIPDGMFVCHRCDNRRCVRPAHLFLGTVTDNNRDMYAKGRNGTRVWGEHHRAAKLTEADVREIRRLYATGEWSTYRLADRYAINQATMYNVVSGKTWKRVA